MKNNKRALIACLVSLFCFAGCSDEGSVMVEPGPGELTEGDCGDGEINVGEVCDDGNTKNGDGCSSNCTSIELGFTCPEPGKPCEDKTKKSVCGNSVVEKGEKCDDGNTNGGDGCSADCMTIEEGFECPEAGEPCIDNNKPEFVCGNGILEYGEACDDFNTRGEDGCSGDCQEIEEGFECPEQGYDCIPILQDICGDLAITGDEECDDGNTNDGDGCSSECKVEEGWYCGEVFCSKKCGNGELDDGEMCDDGDKSVTYDADYPASNEHKCTNACEYAPYCGDGVKQDVEECDDGDNAVEYDSEYTTNGDKPLKCTPTCKFAPYCGDGVFTNSFEKCDPSVEEGNEGCNDNCTPKEGFMCNAIDGSCKKLDTIKCGDEKIEGNEECDQTSNGCNHCQHAENYKCIGSLTAPCTKCEGNHTYSNYPCCTEKAGEQCKRIPDGYGDGIVDPDGNEECDDGNKKNGDGCSAEGKVEAGFVCQSGTTCTPICGDGKILGGEKCDDGNRKGGDGCSQNCTVEEGYYCKAEGEACEIDRCGNSFVGPEEACDGQTGCGADCKSVTKGYCYDKKNGLKACSTTPTCGNYILEYGEECDDGNTLGGDGCSKNCKIENSYECKNGLDCRPTCGDGKVMWQLNEQCDLGSNNGKGKGCSLKCEPEPGFTCTKPSTTFPNSVTLDVTYRDFIGRKFPGSGKGYVNDTVYNELKTDSDCLRKAPSGMYNQPLAAGSQWLATGYGYPDFEGFAGNLCFGLVKEELDKDGKPVFNGKIDDNCCGTMNSDQCGKFIVPKKGETATYNGAVFRDYVGGTKVGDHHVSKLHKNNHLLCGKSLAKWYRDDSSINATVKDSITLSKVSGTESKYLFDSNNMPYNGYFSPLDGKGLKDNNGKDDSGDNHNGSFTTEISTTFQYKGNETLNFSGDDDVWVFINGKLFLDIGGMHARVEGENTLSQNKCTSEDKKKGGTVSRICDERYGIYEGGIYELKVFNAERAASGSNFKLTLDGFVNPSTVTCSSVCGDGILAANEECDLGGKHVNDEIAQKMGCVDCKWTTACGNGRVEGQEACDTGSLCQQDAYKDACKAIGASYVDNPKCDTNCTYKDKLCGNGVVDPGEDCDTGNKDDNLCNRYTCKWYCGDGIHDASKGEECDLGTNNNDDGQTGCTTKCKAAYCGDGVVSPYIGEVCDDGQNVGGYGEGKCMPGCMRKAPYCGDGILQKDHGEVCDLGKNKNNGSYGGCTADCKRASYCGDNIIDAENGEQCDDGPMGSNDCTQNCTNVIHIN